MISIGVDAHKRMHVASALDAHGRELGSWRGPNSASGWDSFSQWLESLGDERRVGIEGAWSYGRQFAQTLVAKGEQVHEVNTRWAAAGRLRARRVDKSDRLDARAVAAFIHRERDALSPIAAEDQTSVLDLLTSRPAFAVVSRAACRERRAPEQHLTPTSSPAVRQNVAMTSS